MTRHYFPLLSICLALLFANCKEEKDPPLSELVNPYTINTVGERQLPAFTVPFGDIRVRPEHDAPLHRTAFSHDYFNVADSRQHEVLSLLPSARSFSSLVPLPDFIKLCQTTFRPRHEQAEPGCYTLFSNENIRTEFAVTKHCGIYSFQFPTGVTHGLILNLNAFTTTDTILLTAIRKIDNRTLGGYRKIAIGNREQYLYFRIEFSRDILPWVGQQQPRLLKNGEEIVAPANAAWIDLGQQTNIILAKVSLSTQSPETAASYLKTELPHWSIDKIKREAKQSWRRLLARVRVKSDDTSEMREFYTALYHAYTIPLQLFNIRESYKSTDDPISIANHRLQDNARFYAQEVFATLGIQPPSRDDNRYQLTPPRFSRVVIRLEQDRRFVIKANRQNDENDNHIQEIHLNGTTLNRTWITREEITQGGTLEFFLTASPTPAS